MMAAMSYKLFFYLTAAISLFQGCTASKTPSSHEEPSIMSQHNRQNPIKISLTQFFGGPFVADPSLTEYVTRIFERLAKVGESPEQLKKIIILNEMQPLVIFNELNEVALSIGILLKLDHEAELAALLALSLSAEPKKAQFTTFDRSKIEGDYLISEGYSHEEYLQALNWIKLAGFEPNALYTLSGKLESLKLSSYNPAHAPLMIDSSESKGYIGVHAFKSALNFLIDNQNHYQLLTEAKNAAKNSEWEKLLYLAQQGIHILPKEPSFFYLKAQALRHLNNHAAALSAINKALILSPNYHIYLLERAKLLDKMAEYKDALTDYQKSYEFFPSDIAKDRIIVLQ